jgi:hypothetical protein
MCLTNVTFTHPCNHVLRGQRLRCRNVLCNNQDPTPKLSVRKSNCADCAQQEHRQKEQEHRERLKRRVEELERMLEQEREKQEQLELERMRRMQP